MIIDYLDERNEKTREKGINSFDDSTDEDMFKLRCPDKTPPKIQLTHKYISLLHENVEITSPDI